MRLYHFRTMIDGRTFIAGVYGDTIRQALSGLRAALRDGETIVGWS